MSDYNNNIEEESDLVNSSNNDIFASDYLFRKLLSERVVYDLVIRRTLLRLPSVEARPSSTDGNLPRGVPKDSCELLVHYDRRDLFLIQ